MKHYRAIIKRFSNEMRDANEGRFTVHWRTKIILEFRVFFVILGDFEVPNFSHLGLILGVHCLHCHPPHI